MIYSTELGKRAIICVITIVGLHNTSGYKLFNMYVDIDQWLGVPCSRKDPFL